MTASMARRIAKMEAGNQRHDEVLLVWRKPAGDIAEAIAGASFHPGDRVICAEWFGEEPLPEPRWYSDRLAAFSDPELYYITRSLRRLVAAEPQRDAVLLPVAAFPQRRLVEMSDADLLHAAIGVAT